MSREKPIVCNSSPLIWLAKIGRLALLKTLFNEIIVPRRVYKEAALQKQSADAILIDKAVEEGWIKVSDENLEEAEALASASGIHVGEAEAILLAQRLGGDLIIDEREASGTAQIFGVRPIGTLAVLLLALARDQITLREFGESLDSLIASGFWLTVDVYNKVLEESESISKRT